MPNQAKLIMELYSHHVCLTQVVGEVEHHEEGSDGGYRQDAAHQPETDTVPAPEQQPGARHHICPAPPTEC